MKIITFIYICCFFLSIIFLPTNGGNETGATVLICATFIGFLGLPHGAVDHILFLKSTKRSALEFYMMYLILIMVYAVFWLFFPLIAMVFFLIMSAYHFGESQFSTLKNDFYLSKILYFVWGCHLLITYLTYQQEALQNLYEPFPDMTAFAPILAIVDFYNIPLIISGIFVLLLFYLLYRKKAIDVTRIFQELYVLTLVHISFYLFGPLLSFTLYFVVLHSLKVLFDEFLFLKKKLSSFSIPAFLRLLIPFTFISLIGIGLLFWLNGKYFILSPIYLILLSISVITLPHAIVMHVFYANND